MIKVISYNTEYESIYNDFKYMYRFISLEKKTITIEMTIAGTNTTTFKKEIIIPLSKVLLGKNCIVNRGGQYDFFYKIGLLGHRIVPDFSPEEWVNGWLPHQNAYKTNYRYQRGECFDRCPYELTPRCGSTDCVDKCRHLIHHDIKKQSIICSTNHDKFKTKETK